ncbi:unnamed protein product [Caenorhabditis angaria]|uniref:DUF1248 domain-containing protein n=1 Tax=Caenorhabditis angaria TaxID=860376 RepID=A0A9P1IBN7_9PELO|nr:unnamed protein product [Caenorhabditis angaria]
MAKFVASACSKPFGARIFVKSETSGKIILSAQGFEYKNVDDNSEMSYIGDFWIDEKYRGKEIMTQFPKNIALFKNEVHSSMKASAFLNFKEITGNLNEYFDRYESIYDKNELQLKPDVETGINLKKICQIPTKLLNAYDQQIFPYHREHYFEKFLKQKDCFSRVALNSAGEVIGYGSIINHNGSAIIQPLYADNADIARKIFCGILKEENLDFQRLYLRTNEDIYTWIQPLLKDGVEARRNKHSVYRYSKEPPKGFDMNKCFAFASSKVCPI